MKLIKHSFLFIFLFIISNSFGQFSPQWKGKESFVSFLNSDTYVVLTNDEAFDAAIRSGMKKYWTHTDFYFIKDQELDKYLKDETLSFIYLTDLVVPGKSQKVTGLALMNGGFAGFDLQLNNTLAYISVDSRGIETKPNDFAFRVAHMVKQLNDVVSVINEQDLMAVDNVKMRNLLKNSYNSKAGQLKTKTLLIDKNYETSKIISLDEFAKKYKYNVQLVPITEIEKAIKVQDPTKAYLVSAWNLYKMNTVTSCQTGEIIYAEFEQEDKISFSSTSTFDYNDVVLLNTTVKKAK